MIRDREGLKPAGSGGAEAGSPEVFVTVERAARLLLFDSAAAWSFPCAGPDNEPAAAIAESTRKDFWRRVPAGFVAVAEAMASFAAAVAAVAEEEVKTEFSSAGLRMVRRCRVCGEEEKS